MNSNRVKRITGMIVKAMTVALIVMGAATFVALKQASADGEFMAKMFLILFGAIIAMQAIPVLLLLGGMIKGLCAAKKVAIETDADKVSLK